MKLNNKKIITIIVISILVGGIMTYGLQAKAQMIDFLPNWIDRLIQFERQDAVKEAETQNVFGATGSRFQMTSEWLQADSNADANKAAIATTTTTYVATTSPTFILANASTTVEINTAGVSDLRFNVTANSTSTVPDITIRRRLIGQNAGLGTDRDYYSVGSLSGGDLTQEDSSIFWNVSTTTSDDFAQTTFQLTNLNTPGLFFDIGTSEPVDISIEFIKVLTF